MDEPCNMIREHLSDDEMVLQYYGEPEARDAAAHLASCEECQARFADLRSVLNSVDTVRVPERADAYGAAVWAQIAPQIRGQKKARPAISWRAMAAVAAMLCIGLAGYMLGRRGVPSQPPPQSDIADVRAKVLLVALSGHLERSRVMMTELANASTPDIGYERDAASDLLESNRLYRQSAEQQGDTQTVVLLEDLERLLTEIAHSPDRLGPAELEELRRRVEEESFKVKILSTRVETQTAEKKGSNNKL